MSRSDGINDEYTIQSLSELYLASINTNVQKTSIQNHTQNILDNLRRRLSMNVSNQQEIFKNRRRSFAKTPNSPLELLFNPPNRFFVQQASTDNSTTNQEYPHQSFIDQSRLSDSEENKLKRKDSLIIESKQKSNFKLSTITKAQCWVNDFLNRPQNPISIIYQLFLCAILLIYLLLIIFTDRTTWHKNCKPIDFDKNEIANNAKGLFEDCLIAHFVIFEWLLRLWSSHSKPEYYRISWYKYIFKYHQTWSHLLDLFIVITGLISATCQFALPLDITQDIYAAIVLRGFHRLFMVAEWTSVQTRHSPIELILQVFHEQGAILFGIFYLQLMLILVVAYVVFHAERHSPDADSASRYLENMLDALYWSTVTLLTIGYGDKVPKTYIGKSVTGFGIVISMALFSLPAGIIATSLAIKISERDAIGLRYQKRTYAAIIIQKVWRFHQRDKRFQKALLIVSRNPDLQNREHIELQVTINRTFRVDKKGKQPKIIHLNQKLREQLLQVSTRRHEYYCSQFIELLKLNVILGKFSDLIKRQQGNSQLSSCWQIIKSHWIEHQQLTSILEKTNEIILSSTDKISPNLASQKQDVLKNKAKIVEYNKIQSNLYELYNILLNEKDSLEKLLSDSKKL